MDFDIWHINWVASFNFDGTSLAKSLLWGARLQHQLAFSGLYIFTPCAPSPELLPQITLQRRASSGCVAALAARYGREEPPANRRRTGGGYAVSRNGVVTGSRCRQASGLPLSGRSRLRRLCRINWSDAARCRLAAGGQLPACHWRAGTGRAAPRTVYAWQSYNSRVSGYD